MSNLNKLSESQFVRFCNIEAGFRSLGFEINSEPVEGMEDKFLDQLTKGFLEMEHQAKYLRSKYGYRGNSARLKAALTHRNPEPVFGVNPIRKFE